MSIDDNWIDEWEDVHFTVCPTGNAQTQELPRRELEALARQTRRAHPRLIPRGVLLAALLVACGPPKTPSVEDAGPKPADAATVVIDAHPALPTDARPTPPIDARPPDARPPDARPPLPIDAGIPDAAPPPPPDAGPPPEPDIVDFAVSPAADTNPERGFYVGINLLTGGTSAVAIRASGHTLAIALVKLQPYRATAIPPDILAGLTVGFRMVRAAGIKVVLRFTYNSDGGADAPLAIVLQHIGQLTPILQANADVIAVVQAGFIGGWGEWHSSTNGLSTLANETLILGALLAALPPYVSVQLRTPMFKDALFPGGPLSQREDTPKGRVGHHNDCFMTTASDYGTYASPIALWKGYVAQEGRFSPIGGETCGVFSPRSDCASAVAEMQENHWTYLNQEYHQQVLANWKTQGCYGEVLARLGYRLMLTRWAMSEEVAPGGVLRLEFTILNDGFAAPFNARPVYLKIGTRVLLLPTDPRAWFSSVAFSLRVRIPADMVPGVYPVSLWLPDSHLSTDGRFDLSIPGTYNLPVSAGASGERSAATTLELL